MSRRIQDIDFVNFLEEGQFIDVDYREIKKTNFDIVYNKKIKLTNEFLKEVLTIFQNCFLSEHSEEEIVEKTIELFELEEYETMSEAINGNRKSQIVSLSFHCNRESCKNCFMFMSCSEFDKGIKENFLELNILGDVFEIKTLDYSVNDKIQSRHHLRWKSEMFLGFLMYWLKNKA